MPITKAVLAALGTRRRRRRHRCRSLPANVPLTKRRRRPKRPIQSRDPYVTGEGGATRVSAARLISPPRGSSLPLPTPNANREGPKRQGTGRSGNGANKEDFTEFLAPEVIRRELSTESRMLNTAARCRAVMTSQGLASLSCLSHVTLSNH